MRIADSSRIVDHLVKTRGVDPDARLNTSQRAIALLVQHTQEEHYAFVLAYTHLVRDDGLRHTRARFDSVPAIVRPLVARSVLRRIKKLLWHRGILRHSDQEILQSGLRDWRAVLTLMCGGPFFFGANRKRVYFVRTGRFDCGRRKIGCCSIPHSILPGGSVGSRSSFCCSDSF